jgi:hypothetical protein
MLPPSLAVAWTKQRLLFAFLVISITVFYSPPVATTVNAFVLPSSVIYTLKHTQWNFLRAQCAVGQYSEPDTAITMTLTDGFSKYIGVTFPTDKIAKITGHLPYALYSIFTIYTDNAREIETGGVLLDSEIQLNNPDMPNPYVPGNAIVSANGMSDRAYTIYASRERPDFIPTNSSSNSNNNNNNRINWMSTDSGNREKISVFILRVVGEYGDAQGLSNYEWVPTVTLLDPNTGQTEFCNFLLDQGRLPTIGLENTYSTPLVAPKDCRIYDADVFPTFHFYPTARQSHGFANTAHGGYLIADVNHEADDDGDTRAFVVEIKIPPRVFDPQGQMANAKSSATNDTNTTTAADTSTVLFTGDEDVRYTSLCLYSHYMTNMFRGNNCISGIDIYNHYRKHGTAYIVGGDPSLREHFESRGALFLELVASDIGAAMHRWPKLIYRVQLYNNNNNNANDYVVDDHVPRWDEQCDAKALSSDYYQADNPENWGDYAPIGRQCSSEDVVTNACGFAKLAMILQDR